MAASIGGFKTPQADLHRKSPKIFAASALISLLCVTIGIHVPCIQTAGHERKTEPARMNDKPVKCWVVIPITFEL